MCLGGIRSGKSWQNSCQRHVSAHILMLTSIESDFLELQSETHAQRADFLPRRHENRLAVFSRSGSRVDKQCAGIFIFIFFVESFEYFCSCAKSNVVGFEVNFIITQYT